MRGRGFTYLGLLFAIALAGAALALAGTVWQTVVQREKEKQLLFAGGEIRDAIGRYYLRTPGITKEFPRRLQDLILDTRYPTIERHLRKIYVDPFTGKPDWALVIADGRIVGVHSLSQLTPVKVGGFELKNAGFREKRKYSEWVFAFQGDMAAGGGVAGQAPPETTADAGQASAAQDSAQRGGQ